MQFPDVFRGISSFKVGDGKSYLFWDDLWNNKIRSGLYPRAYSFAKSTKESVYMTSTKGLSQRTGFLEYLIMSADDPLVQLSDDRDLWSYARGNSFFSSQKEYAMNFMHIQAPCYLNWIWKSKCTMKVKSF